MLSTPDGGVTEKLLELCEVVGAVEELDSKRMAKGMRVDIRIQSTLTDYLDYISDTTIRNLFSKIRSEEIPLLPALLSNVRVDPGFKIVVDKDDPFLLISTLRLLDVDGIVVPDVFNPQIDELV